MVLMEWRESILIRCDSEAFLRVHYININWRIISANIPRLSNRGLTRIRLIINCDDDDDAWSSITAVFRLA